MKHFFTLAVCICAMLLTSCQFSENIYINEDGSGKMEFTLDGSEMMQMISQMGDGTTAEGMDKAMDSTIVFKEFIKAKKDSIAKLSAEDQEKIKSLEDFTMHVKTNPETNEMLFDLTRDFKSADELQDMFKAMNNFSNLQGQDGSPTNSANSPFASLGENGSTDVNYAFDGTTFKRSAKIIDKELHQQTVDSLGQAEMMFGSSKYKINYHFPRAVKSFSKEGAMYSEDRKTVTFEVGFLEVLKDPELLNLEVVLEDK